MKIIDTHVYCLPKRLRDPRVQLTSSEQRILKAIHQHKDGEWVLPLSSEDEILRSMDKSGLDKSVLVAFPWASESLCRENSEFILNLVHKHPQSFEAVCSLQARDPASLKNAETYLNSGARGLKINPDWQNTTYEDSALDSVAELVAKKKAYILCHVDQAFKISQVTPAYFLNFAKRNPNTKLVAAHMGGLLGLYNHLEFLAPQLQNLWFDTAISESLEIVNYYILAGLEDRILFGSDYPFNFCHSQKDVVERLNNLNISKDQIEKIFSINYLKLIGEL